MKRSGLVILFLSLVLGLTGCSFKVTKPMLQVALSRSMKVSTKVAYADSLEKRIGLPYVQDGDPAQVLDIYYAIDSVRKDAVLVDIHGGFYVAGRRENKRRFASFFLKEGFDVVLIEYRLNDGTRDVADELADCAAGLDYLATHARELGLNPDRMFLTGDSAGGHLALYMAEGIENKSMPIRPKVFRSRGVLLNCPAYDFAMFPEVEALSQSAIAWFVGPRYKDKELMQTLSPRTYIGTYSGPLFLSTCKRDFIRSESMLLKADCDSLSRPLDFVDIDSNDRRVRHVHNVSNPHLPESQEVNSRMAAFMDKYLK